jgi:CRISPR system Cascade subunit CasB
MTHPFDKDSPETGILTRWWQGLENDKGTRAELRRCDTPEKVIFHPVFPRLCHQLEPMLGKEWNWELRLAAVVGLLSHVRNSTGQKLAYQMSGNPPNVSELRFRRLLQRERDDLYGAMIRILQMLDRSANLQDLMASTFNWGDPVRKRWAYDYFPNTPASKTA